MLILLVGQFFKLAHYRGLNGRRRNPEADQGI